MLCESLRAPGVDAEHAPSRDAFRRADGEQTPARSDIEDVLVAAPLDAREQAIALPRLSADDVVQPERRGDRRDDAETEEQRAHDAGACGERSHTEAERRGSADAQSEKIRVAVDAVVGPGARHAEILEEDGAPGLNKSARPGSRRIAPGVTSNRPRSSRVRCAWSATSVDRYTEGFAGTIRYDHVASKLKVSYCLAVSEPPNAPHGVVHSLRMWLPNVDSP